MKNQLKKVAIGVGATFYASESAGLETNVRGALAIFASCNPGYVVGHNYCSYLVEADLCASYSLAAPDSSAVISCSNSEWSKA